MVCCKPHRLYSSLFEYFVLYQNINILNNSNGVVITDFKKKSTLYNTERRGIGKKDNFPADFISLYTNNAEVEKLHIL